MSQYLQEEEIFQYCTSQAGVTLNDIIIASQLIDGYLGKSFGVNQATETVIVNSKLRGKLNHSPVVEIKSVSELVYTLIGVTKTDVNVSNIVLDAENDGYFYYVARISPFASLNYGYDCCNQLNNRKLEITYSYGYNEIPIDIKLVTAMLAQNIQQLQSFVGFKKLNTLDYTVEMSNPSFFTDDMRMLLNKYKG